MRIHSGKKPYSCKQCEYPQGHLFSKGICSLIQGKSPFIAPICTSSFTQRGHFKEHMSTHSGERRFSCDQCNYSCIQANDIKKHMLQHSGENPFACNQCSFSCRRTSRLKYHMLSHAGEKPFACKKCKKFMQAVPWFENTYENAFLF